MQAHSEKTNHKYAHNATTGPRRVHTVAELRMALEDKARGQRIAEFRKRKHLTQQAMAERLGIAYRTYQTWEAGTMPEWDNLEKLSLFFGVRPEDIIGDDARSVSVQEQSQLDRLEAEVGAIRAELGEVLTRLEETQQILVRIAGTGSSASRSRKAK